MTNEEYEIYKERYRKQFIRDTFEDIVIDIEENKLDSEYLKMVVEQLNKNKFQYDYEYNDIIRYILNIEENNIDIDEAKQNLIRKLINKKDGKTLLFMLSRGNGIFCNLDGKKSIIKLMTEEMITKFILLMVNKYEINKNDLLIFNLETILKNITCCETFNKFHKNLLYRELKNNKELMVLYLLDKIFLERHNNQQELYKMQANDKIVLNYFEFY